MDEENKCRILKCTFSFLAKNLVIKKSLTKEDLKNNMVQARYVIYEDIPNTVYLEKIKDGKVVEITRIGSYNWWKRINKYSTEFYLSPTSAKQPKDGCPLDCGLCKNHKNRTVLLNIVLTNRCNSFCPYCFFYSHKVGYVYEPSIEEILEMVKIAKRFNGGKIYAAQLTGGEPTLRRDLPEIIKALKREGITHIQLNTNGIKIGLMYYKNSKDAIKYVKTLRSAGVNTVYMSFDGVSPEINTKNHWFVPFTLEAFYEGELTSVVLVPTLINGWNFPNELEKIVLFAAYHTHVIRGINFQPVSFVGYMKTEEVEKVEKERVTISDVIEEFKKLSSKVSIPEDAWYPVPTIVPFLIAIGKEDLGFYNHAICGVATYVYVEKENGKVKKLHPITEFIDVDKLYEEFLKIAKKKIKSNKMLISILTKIGRLFGKIVVRKFIKKFIINNELPDGTKVDEMIINIITKKNYNKAGEFHYKFLFIGMMHFQDLFNYDIERVQRCSIHYATPEGPIPFCTYNVLSSIYRDRILRENAIKDKELEMKLQEEAKNEFLEVEEIRRSWEIQEKLKQHPVYRKYYSILLNTKE